jgi:hypothetical protein
MVSFKVGKAVPHRVCMLHHVSILNSLHLFFCIAFTYRAMSLLQAMWNEVLSLN